MQNSSTKTVRIVTIIHLCIVFTAIASIASYPFLGKLFSYKKQAFLYHYVMGDTTLASKDSMEYQRKLERNQKRFSLLPEEKQLAILAQYKKLVNESEQPFLNKLRLSLEILIFKIPLYERAWLIFSIIICILILLKNENVSKAVWILPLLTLLYLINNQMHGEPQEPPPDLHLFPSEKMIVEDYLQSPLSGHIFEQKEQLTRGWNRYLVENWAKEIPDQDPFQFERQVEEGEYAFSIARLNLYEKAKLSDSFHEKSALSVLLLYLLWNLFLAYKVRCIDRVSAVA